MHNSATYQVHTDAAKSKNQMMLQIRSSDNTVVDELVAVSELVWASQDNWISEVQKVRLAFTCA